MGANVGRYYFLLDTDVSHGLHKAGAQLRLPKGPLKKMFECEKFGVKSNSVDNRIGFKLASLSFVNTFSKLNYM